MDHDSTEIPHANIHVTAGASAGSPDLVLVVTQDGSDIEICAEHLQPLDALELAETLVRMATTTMKFRELVGTDGGEA